MKKRKIAVLGATGLVGRKLVTLLVDHPWFDLAMLVGSDASAGEVYKQVWNTKEQPLQKHYGSHFWKAQAFPEQLQGHLVEDFACLLHSDIDFVFSSLPERAGPLEQALLAKGCMLFSNSPYGRFDPVHPLVVAEVNGEKIKDQKFIKTPNCVTSGLALILAPFKEAYGLQDVIITTYQSISGRGDAKYAPELVAGNVYPLRNSSERTEEYILKEIKKVFAESIRISVSCHRVWVQEGHLVDLRIKTIKRIKSKEEAARVLLEYTPLQSLDLPTRPLHPLVLVDEPGRPRPCQDAWHDGGMAVAIGNLSTSDEIYDLKLTFVVNNVVRGAAGGAVLNAEMYLAVHDKAFTSI